ncbi:hypothetical protein KJ059_03355 [Myxococcota bacterium]|nr:hypothetical protein [Myxococcota bacterium]MCZ7619001.1 hypothetical protein [Myxococcota bacterium]
MRHRAEAAQAGDPAFPSDRQRGRGQAPLAHVPLGACEQLVELPRIHADFPW